MTGKFFRKTRGKKVLSAFLSFVMAFSMMQCLTLSSFAAVSDTRVSDPSTMDGWKQFFGAEVLSTHNAGGVWTDKSVLKDTLTVGSGRDQITISLDGTENESFLVALSAIASNAQVTGKTSAPLDTMLVLDVSGSMNNNSGNNDAVEDLVDAANAAVNKLLDAGSNNRVGVVLYSSDASVLLPLGRYTTANDDNYFSYTTNGGNEYISVDSDVRVEGTNTRPATNRTEVVGATFIQSGIAFAKDQFIASGNETTVDGTARKPVMIVMSDGNPTYSTTDYTDPDDYNLGTGSASSTSVAQGFVTQLTASYAKQQIKNKYGTDPLFYTLGFKVDRGSIAESVLDPSNSVTGIDDLWDDWDDADVGDDVAVETSGEWVNNGSWWNPDYEYVETTTDVVKIAGLSQNYVDKYFSTSSSLTGAFEDIVGEALLQAKYHPTLVSGSDDLDGYVSFVDKIGKYMEVKDIKGILIGDHLFSGADLSSNFVTGGGNLGTYDNPTALGNEMVSAVQARLGIADVDTARTLIALAYEHGQLSFTSPTEFSNYIGWYANANGEYLGFYNEGTTILPEATGNDATDPAFIVRSYGYLGEVDSEHGVTESDMMYATVQVRKNIQTGEELVTFAIPAALIPIVTYEVTLNEQEELEDLTVSGAESPIRLVYEVGLQDNINSLTLHDPSIVDPAYIAANENDDGSVNFYTNQYEVNGNVGYGTVNTYAYFNPAKQNDRYYYTEDSLIYTDTNGTLYNGATDPSASRVYYRGYTVYAKNGTLQTKTFYEPISSYSLEKAQKNANNTWYIPAGIVHTYIGDYNVYKDPDNTKTLIDPANNRGVVNIPFVDVTNHSVDESGYYFYVGATLGNNGKLTVSPATGIALSKDVEGASTNESFIFTITGSDADAGRIYPAVLYTGATKTAETNVPFNTSGIAQVSLKAGQTIFITGMTPGREYTITENESIDYIVSTVNGATASKAEIRLEANELSPAAFVNVPRSKGDLTITKEIHHELGADYTINPDKKFTVEVTLSGIGTANQTFDAEHTDLGRTSISTDANGKFTVTLAHAEQIEIFDLPVGTVANVKEVDYNSAFTPKYMVNGTITGNATNGANATVASDIVASVIIVNDYDPAPVDPPINITVSGNKVLSGRDWLSTDSFTFRFEKYDATDDEWKSVNGVADIEVKGTDESKSFTFADAFANESYPTIGTYFYRVVEVIPDDRIAGITYDRTVHSFGVVVEDDLSGQLKVVDVVPYRSSTTVSDTATGWNVVAEFTNAYNASGSATVSIDLTKRVSNPALSPNTSLAGFKFQLLNADGSVAYTSGETTDRGFTRLVISGLDTVGTYTYTLKEVVPNPVPKGWNYDTHEATVTIVVENDYTTGGYKAVIFKGATRPGDASSSIAETFTNTYSPETDTADLYISADKTLNGRDMKAGEFTFVIHPHSDEDTILATGKNAAAADGEKATITFDKPLTFTKVGIYEYDLGERTADGNGITTDKNHYHLIVTVTDDGGELKSTYTVANTTENTIHFVNTYKATETTHTIRGNKTLNGKALVNDEFTFVLKEVDESGRDFAGALVYEAKNFADGSFRFETISYTEEGEYYYKVYEQKKSVAHGIIFDETEYFVTVKVTDDGLGSLSASQTIDSATAISFTNTYTAAATEATIDGDKVLTGKTLSAGAYTFELYASNSNWAQGALIEGDVKNDINGDFTFTRLGTLNTETGKYEFTEAGNYYYLVKEKNGGSEIDGVFYDPSVYRVLVVVTDDLEGQLHATVHTYTSTGIPTQLVFTNEYHVVYGATAEISGKKVLTEIELEDEMFLFNLFEADESFNKISDDPIDTIANIGEDFKFEIEYAPDDIETGTFYYVVEEKNAGEKIDDIEYSTATFNVIVTVTDGGEGRVVTEVEVVDGPIVFTNVYAPTPEDITVDIVVNKTVKNEGSEQIGPDGFEFVLEYGDGQPQKIRTDKNGKAEFELTFTAENVGETFTYKLYETDEGKENIEYSDKVYEFSIEIKKENHKLYAYLNENPVAVSSSIYAFENVYDYTPETPKDPEEPKDPTNPNDGPTAPNTGDVNSLNFWMIVMILSLGAVLTLSIPSKKRGKANQR